MEDAELDGQFQPKGTVNIYAKNGHLHPEREKKVQERSSREKVQRAHLLFNVKFKYASFLTKYI